MSLNSLFIAESLRLLAPKPESFNFSAVITDSRKTTQNSLFLALKGDFFDGHDFIEKAIQSGAKGIICKNSFSGKIPPQILEFRVEDTLEAYRSLAKAWRSKFNIPLIAIGGSFGKTTTKELLSAILLGKWNSVLKTEGSQNGFVGIPMTLLKLNQSHQAAVIEIGIDELGAMQKHVQLISPTAALLTGIGPEHLEKLKDVKTVAHEEGLLLSSVAKTGGACAINLDDEWIRTFAHLKAKNKIFYSFNQAALSAATQNILSSETLIGTFNPDPSTLNVSGNGLETFSLKIPLPGIHNARNLLGAVAAARLLGLAPQEIKTGLQNFKGAPGRSEIYDLSQGIKVICDYYNASPPSTEAALQLLGQIASHSLDTSSPKKWACLGDMLELGLEEEHYHRSLAKKIISLSINRILLYGVRMQWLLDELKKCDFKGQVEHFKTHGELSQTLIKQISKNDVVLIKGSRGMKMEEVWMPIQKAFSK